MQHYTRHLTDTYARNSKPKCFEETVLMSFTDVFSETAFNSIPE
jgi:hypothetical protein